MAGMRFAELVEQWNRPMNALYMEKESRTRSGKGFKDLITGHPSIKRKESRYAPDPLGQRAARKAISRFYGQIPPEHIVLTPGTSLSYWYAFRLFANPGDEILCPQPSYPLFQSIADLAGVQLTFYPLIQESRWTIDQRALNAAITSKTKAIVLVSPHNPTGAVATSAEVQDLAAVAQTHRLPIFSDEVFCSFVYEGKFSRIADQKTAPLVLTFNGFSKMFARPGAKTGWIAVSGQPDLVQKTMKGFEMMSDTFLPVNEDAQAAVPAIFRKDQRFLKNYQRLAIKARTTTEHLLKEISDIAWVTPEGGFYWTVRLPNGTDEEEVALTLLKKGFLVHPGYFYDLEGSHLVFHFLQNPKTLTQFTKELANLRL